MLNLSKKKNIILTGDLNVSHKEIDIFDPKRLSVNPGFTIQERNWVLLKYTNRYLYPDKVI